MKLDKELDVSLQRELEKSYFIGRLVTEDELAETMVDAPVSVQNEHISFYLKCLSPIPKQIYERSPYKNNIFNGRTSSKVNMMKFRAMYPHFDRLLLTDKRNKITDYLLNKLVVFKLVVRQLYLYAEIETVEDKSPAEHYIAIPIPENVTMGAQRQADFKRKLLENLPIKLPNYSKFFPRPPFIYLGTRIYGGLDLKDSQIPITYYLEHPERVRSMTVSEHFQAQIDVRMANLLFMNAAYKFELQEQLQEGEPLVTVQTSSIAEESITPMMPIAQPMEETTAQLQERQFIEMIEANARQRGLFYRFDDILNFHISLKTNAMTIVGGMSGTGKSQLAKLYGETMGLKLHDTMLMVPISPAFREPSDLLGFFNPTTNEYYENESGFVTLLRKAQDHPEQMFMVIFDEMNLAQVEHWFAPFISLLELDRDERVVHLFNASSATSRNGYPSRIALGNNLMFVGTVNFDETTKSFSNRLLDRANLISPQKLTFAEVRKQYQLTNEAPARVQQSVATDVYRGSWLVDSFGLETLTEQEIELLDEIHRLMHESDQQKGVSFRALNGIASYIANIPKASNGTLYLSRSVAFDLQLKQRILSKISGSASAITTLVGSFEANQWVHGSIATTLHTSTATEIGTFEHSLRCLTEKAKELHVHGYAN